MGRGPTPISRTATEAAPASLRGLVPQPDEAVVKLLHVQHAQLRDVVARARRAPSGAVK